MATPQSLIKTSLIILILLTGGFFLLKNKSPAIQKGQWLDSTLKTSWQYYKSHMMVNGERVRSNNYKGTISEGQSYALLKSVWMDDPKTFEQTWQWTKNNLRRPNDKLFGWRWGKGARGVYRLLETENATDADQDIAYALLLAGKQWKKPEYIAEAQDIIKDIWRLNVQKVQGKYYLNPGTWKAFQEGYLTLNPSYFAPYVYRHFAHYDKKHAKGWQALAKNIYPTLEACSKLTSNKLPPNWCSINWETGAIGWSDKQGEGSRDFSYDAFRVFWRMAMDDSIDDSDNTGKAKAYLRQHQTLLDYWETNQQLPEGFHPDGSPRNPEASSSSGFALSALVAQSHVLNPQKSKTLYEKTLKSHYHDEGYWFNTYNDFLHSVIWFHLYSLSHKGIRE